MSTGYNTVKIQHTGIHATSQTLNPSQEVVTFIMKLCGYCFAAVKASLVGDWGFSISPSCSLAHWKFINIKNCYFKANCYIENLKNIYFLPIK